MTSHEEIDMKPMSPMVLGLIAFLAACSSANAAMPVRLMIEDNAGLFSEAAREEAKAKLARLQSPVNREVHIQTYKELPESQSKALEAAKGDKAKVQGVWEAWAAEHLKGDRGLVVLINWEPGKVMVKTDKAVTNAGYSNASASELRERLIKSLGEAKKNNNEADRKKLLDEALASAVSLIATTLPLERGRAGAPAHLGGENDNGILGYVCLGLLGLMVVWLIVGLFRGAMAGPSMSPAMGGGGGGFFSSLLGGMFGAAAGMWMYNSFFGSNNAWGSSWGGSNAGWGSGGDEAGSGDFSDGSSSSGDFGGGDFGGGDFGGGDSGGGDF